MSRSDERPAFSHPDAGDSPSPPGNPERFSREALQQRLDHLAQGHPSSPRHSDGTPKPPPPNLRALELTLPEDRPAPIPPADSDHLRGVPRPDTPIDRDYTPPKLEPLTDTEHTEHIQYVEHRLDQARTEGLATDQQYLVDAKLGIWTDERDDIHQELLTDLYAKAAAVPSDHRAIMAGGLGGAGKSTVLEGYAGIDRSQYLTINPDDIKEEMAARGLIPEVEGLSPMEASDLVHEESSYLAKQLAERALRDGKNVIWDITMSSRPSTERRLDDLESAGYTVKGIFVDIPVEVSVSRAGSRHRIDHEKYRNGTGMGGRCVPAEVIRAQEDPEWGSVNRRTFEEIKGRLDSWSVYDNSVSGRAPVLEASGGEAQDPRRAE